jgi:DNA-binding NarL/FixJ family response regulator
LTPLPSIAPRFGAYASPAVSNRFTPRERQVIEQLRMTRSVVATARHLGISVHTARAHVKAIALELANPHGLPALRLILSHFERV